ncbi:MAG: glycerate kinase [Candidatus Rokuibacteriota bacterium]|nr:MAG: glycerate kinase [Candidatus Rokubacteria bacterium]
MTSRDAVRAIWEAALAAGDVTPLVRRHLHLDRRHARIFLLGAGKASGAMAAAAEEVAGDRVAGGFVVVKDGYGGHLRRVEIAEAGHPVPDARGLAASARLLEVARSAGEGDLVLFLVSGGGSALTLAPAPPITLAEKQEVTRLLLASGAAIGELNAVRKHLSAFKGGQLARAAAPAAVLTLALSDVIGDPLDVIASGPTAPDPTTFADALEVLARRGLSGRVPPSVARRLEAGRAGEIQETPKPGDPLFERVANVVIGNNALVTDAAAATARRLGYRTDLATRELQGEARDVAREFVARARRLPPSACLIAGGETTVTVRGPGKGGRCQEFALAAALALEPTDRITILAAGTDGTDGPTDATGAIVDAGSIARGSAAGADARRALADNDAYRFLRASDDLLVSGPTRTNLLDLYVAVSAT